MCPWPRAHTQTCSTSVIRKMPTAATAVPHQALTGKANVEKEAAAQHGMFREETLLGRRGRPCACCPEAQRVHVLLHLQDWPSHPTARRDDVGSRQHRTWRVEAHACGLPGTGGVLRIPFPLPVISICKGQRKSWRVWAVDQPWVSAQRSLRWPGCPRAARSLPFLLPSGHRSPGLLRNTTHLPLPHKCILDYMDSHCAAHSTNRTPVSFSDWF